MKLKWSTLLFLFSTILIHADLRADTKSSLFLRAFVASSITTSIRESRLSSGETLWLLSSQTNGRYPLEGQKFEVEGLDQAGLEAHLKKIVASDHTILHEILISSLKFSMKKHKIIFLKISAN